MGLFGSNGYTAGKYLDLFGFGPGGFPSQLAPTTNRKGRVRWSALVLVPVVVKVCEAGSVASNRGCCFGLIAHVARPYLHRFDGRGIGWGRSGVKDGIPCHV